MEQRTLKSESKFPSSVSVSESKEPTKNLVIEYQNNELSETALEKEVEKKIQKDKQLKTLLLNNCSNISEIFTRASIYQNISELKLWNLPKLSYVGYTNNNSVKDLSLADSFFSLFGKKDYCPWFPKLENFSVYHCENLLQINIQAENLKILEISNAPQLSILRIEKIECLENLYIYYLKKLFPTELSELITKKYAKHLISSIGKNVSDKNLPRLLLSIFTHFNSTDNLLESCYQYAPAYYEFLREQTSQYLSLSNEERGKFLNKAEVLSKQSQQNSDSIHNVMLPKLLNLALNDPSEKVKVFAAASLVGLGQNSPLIVKFLLKVLTSTNNTIRKISISVLVDLKKSNFEINGDVKGILLQALQDDNDFVKQAAALSLIALGNKDSSVVNALLSMLKNENSEWITKTTALSLGELKDFDDVDIQRVIKALGVKLECKEFFDVSEAAAKSLFKLGQKKVSAITILLDALRESSGRCNPYIKKVIALLLGELQVIHKSNHEQFENTIEILYGALRNHYRIVKQAAASSLIKLSKEKPAIINRLIEMFINSDLYGTDSEMRRAIALSFGELELNEDNFLVIDVLLGVLQDCSVLQNADRGIGQAAASALIKLGKKDLKVILILCNALKDSEWHIRKDAAESLGKLIEMYKFDTEVTSHVLTSINIKAALEALFSKEKVSDVKHAAAVSLFNLGVPNSADLEAFLLQNLKDDLQNSIVKQDVAVCLGKLNNPSCETIKTLCNILIDDASDINLDVTQAALESLLKLGKANPPVVIRELRTFLDNPKNVQEIAVNLLMELEEISTEPSSVIAFIDNVSNNTTETTIKCNAALLFGKAGKYLQEKINYQFTTHYNPTFFSSQNEPKTTASPLPKSKITPI